MIFKRKLTKFIYYSLLALLFGCTESEKSKVKTPDVEELELNSAAGYLSSQVDKALQFQEARIFKQANIRQAGQLGSENVNCSNLCEGYTPDPLPAELVDNGAPVVEPTVTPNPTAIPVASVTPTPTVSPVASVTPTPEPTVSPIATVTPTPTATPMTEPIAVTTGQFMLGRQVFDGKSKCGKKVYECLKLSASFSSSALAPGVTCPDLSGCLKKIDGCFGTGQCDQFKEDCEIKVVANFVAAAEEALRELNACLIRSTERICRVEYANAMRTARERRLNQRAFCIAKTFECKNHI